MQTLSDLRSRPHTSISAIKCFIQCPRQFKLRYIDRIKPAFRSAFFAFGSAWHDTVDCWLTSNATQDELRQRLRDKLTVSLADEEIVFDDEDESAQSLVDMSIRMLDIFLVKVARPEKTIAVEVPFSLELAHPVTAEILPVRFIGSIDALVIEQGVESIWELKTGKRKWGADALDYDLQTTSYKIAARDLGRGEIAPTLVLTTKTNQPDVQVERLVRHKRDERELVETVFAVHRAVDAGVDHPIRGWQCRTCAWAGACGP
jgi:CRISPR/Cas system-associated exonuclease Cas4 (RecB family)